MFGLGGSELLIIVLIVLFLFAPSLLVGVIAYFAGFRRGIEQGVKSEKEAEKTEAERKKDAGEASDKEGADV